jgi:hypothetical protein
MRLFWRFCLFCVLSVPSISLQAQVFWQGDDLVNSQSWHVAGNWDSNTVPTSSSEVVVGAPAPTVISTATANVLTLDVLSEGEIEIQGGRALTFFGDSLVNNGVITVNSNNSSSVAFLNLGSQGVEITGSGEIVLAAPTSLANLTNNTLPFIHGEDHTIRGEGQISAQFINNGTITAEDINGDSVAELLLNTGAKVNNGVFKSSPTAALRIATNFSQGSSGEVIADTSSVFMDNISITGGTLRSVNGGIFRTSFNAMTFNAVDQLAGQLNLVSGSGFTGNLVVRGGGFSNNGTILVNQDNFGASGIRFAESGTIDGTGEIILNSSGLGAQILTDNGAIVATLGQGQTVRGVGRISAELINNGVIIAEPRNGGTLLEFSNLQDPKTNNNLIRADTGASIRINSTSITQDAANGQIFANGGNVELGTNSHIIGGWLEAASGGKFIVSGNPARLENVVNNAPIEVPNGPVNLSLLGATFENNNVVTVSAGIRADSNISITGNGVIQLSLSSGCCANFTVSSGFTAKNTAGHTIRAVSGNTRIQGPGTIVNNGLMEGASPTQLLEVNTRLEGEGTLKNVRPNQVHAPGDGIGQTAQVMLEGQYTMTSFGASIEMEIGGTIPGLEYDQLFSVDPTNVITIGSANTQLNVSLINGFFPSNGDVFTLIDTVGTMSANFNSINLPALPSGYAWSNVSDANTIAYQLIAPLAADFDVDGDVDGDDLMFWQTGYGTSMDAVKIDGDADEDGDVDGRDFLAWQRQFGSGIPTAGVASVPEPSTLLLLALSGVWFRGRCSTQLFR